ncbi:MAG: DoxX family protein [Caulobacteraceae bacterium]|nr:DoxX family protein [Caulobacteraceae bacterium]
MTDTPPLSEPRLRPEDPAALAWIRAAGRLPGRLLPDWLIALTARTGIAAVFFLSGRTKVDGLIAVSDSALFLFAEEYRLPLIPGDLAAHLATYAEHLFPVLLVLGLLTRLSAVALLVMTAVIQVLVYPGAWSTHLVWAGLLVYLIRYGAGAVSLDRLWRID